MTARSEVDRTTQGRSHENYSDKEPTKGMEQELNAAGAAGPYVKQQAKERELLARRRRRLAPYRKQIGVSSAYTATAQGVANSEQPELHWVPSRLR